MSNRQKYTLLGTLLFISFLWGDASMKGQEVHEKRCQELEARFGKQLDALPLAKGSE